MKPAFLVLSSAAFSLSAAAFALPGGITTDYGHGASECARCKELAPLAPQWFDGETGRDTRSFPPHRHADFSHIALDLTIEDMNTPRMTGTATISFTPLGTPMSVISLDARCMAVRQVSHGGTSIPFSYDGAKIVATFAAPLPTGAATSVTIDYEVSYPTTGVMWTPESPAWPGRPAQLHTQGEPETNSYWFPCHDSPNDKIATEVRIKVPAGFEASSNGKLVSRANDGAFTRFHYSQDQEHVAYLVSLVVGKFDIVDLAGGPVPMRVWVPPGRGSDVEGTFGRTAQMATLFGEITGETYPWAKYDQLLVWNFGWGGMENTSVTTLYDTAILSEGSRQDHDLDGLISHELAHQWFGDLITCNSWEHIWLNEGFATYFSHLWFERRDGRDAYIAGVRGNFDGIIAADSGSIPEAAGMVSKVHKHPWETFRRPANPYGKGASILHMLRVRLGDDRFFAGVKEYVHRRRFATAETSDLRRAFEDVSGESLEQFFRQWCERPGVPHLSIAARYDDSADSLIIEAHQTQLIDGDNPAFEFDLPITIYAATGAEPRTEILSFRGRTASLSVPLAAEPQAVAFDPNLSVLAKLHVSQPDAWSLGVLKNSNAPEMTRIAAIRLLGRSESTIGELEGIALDKKASTRLRAEAVRAMGSKLSERAAIGLLMQDNWEIKVAACEAVGAGSLEIIPLLQKSALNAHSEKVKAAAIRALGKRSSGAAIIESALATDSQDDAVRQAALDALLDSKATNAFEVALKLSGPGNYSRTRAAATAAIGRVFEKDPDLAITTLERLITDDEVRVRLAAGEALVATRRPQALEVLKAAEQNACGRDAAWLFGNWKRALTAAIDDGTPE